MIVNISDALLYMRSEQVVDRSIVEQALDAAHSVFYDMCQRSFEVASTATARTYVPTSTSILRIHDCTTVTAVSVDGGTVSLSGVQTEPNGPTWAGEVRPIEQLRFLNRWWLVSTPGKATVSVTATWGWAATPDPAIAAVKALTKDIATNRDVRAGFLSFGDAGVAAARSNGFVKDVAARWGRGVEMIGIAG